MDKTKSMMKTIIRDLKAIKELFKHRTIISYNKGMINIRGEKQ